MCVAIAITFCYCRFRGLYKMLAVRFVMGTLDIALCILFFQLYQTKKLIAIIIIFFFFLSFICFTILRAHGYGIRVKYLYFLFLFFFFLHLFISHTLESVLCLLLMKKAFIIPSSMLNLVLVDECVPFSFEKLSYVI